LASRRVNKFNQESSLSINSLSLLGDLSDSEKQWIGDRIYQNECASKV